MPSITITDQAAAKGKELLAADAEERRDPGLRVRVVGGGCSGLMYQMDFADGPAEGDEVFDGMLLAEVARWIKAGYHDLAVHRIQMEQNFQRVRWYPWPVHRVFPKGTVRKVGETTDRHADATVVAPEYGYLWDVTNCFRDNWVGRLDQQSKLRGGEPLNTLAVPIHTAEKPTMGDVKDWELFFNQPHWTWKRSPFDLPGPLERLVGMTKYEPGV